MTGTIKKFSPRFEEIAKSDPFFNARVAQKVYDLVMKMDDDVAREFTYHVVNEVVEDTIEKNLRTLQGHLDQVIAKRHERVRKAVLKAAGKQQAGAVEFAKAFSELTKADNASGRDLRGAERAKFNELHPRADGGRFRTKVRSVNKPPLKGRHAAALGIPVHQHKLSPEDRSRYQQEYLQVRDFLNTVQQSTDGNADVLLHVQDKRTGQESVVRHNGTRVDPSAWNPIHERVVGVDARPNSLNVGGAYFGLASALGGDPGTNQIRGINAVDQNFQPFAADWTREGFDPTRPNDRMYNRIKAGSNFLSQVAPVGSKAQIAAQFGQFVGSHGPEAEAVFGPVTRRTAYRYRGTEREPAAELTQNYEAAVQRGKMSNIRARSDHPTQLAAARAQATRRTPTFEELAGGRREVVDYLNSEGVRPRSGLYNLQLASGNTPPSEGVIINSQGQIASQAIGYGDDHYLPFNLKHLKDLKNGEYIRNRSVGGPTSEDIYTGLVAGARQLTVTSRSGDFTVKFKDDFRGGRRHNDKAKRMVRRYEQILDAVQSQQVDNIDVDPPVRQAITAMVRQEMAGPAYTSREIHDEVNRRIEEYKSSPDIGPEEEKIAELQISRLTEGGTTRDAAKIRRDIYRSMAEDKEYKFRLNGRGYAAALQALQEQFPYYIDVTANVLHDEERRRHVNPQSLDSGYVEPGRNRPTAARGIGLYGTEVNQGVKRGRLSASTASHADYQGVHIERRGGTSNGEGEPTEEPEKKVEKPKSAATQIQEMETTAKYVDQAVGLRGALKGVGIEGAKPPGWDLDDAQFGTWLEKRDNQEAFHAYIQQHDATLGRVPELQSALADYKLASGWVGRKPYEAVLNQQWNPQPFAFEGEAYGPGASSDVVKREMDRIHADSPGIVHTKPLSQMTDPELKAEVTAVGTIRRTLGDKEALSREDKQQLLVGFSQESRESPSMAIVARGAQAMDDYLERVHRVRALNMSRSAEERAGQPEPAVTVNHGPAEINAGERWRTNTLDSVATTRRQIENDPDSDDVELELVGTLERDLEQAEITSDEEAEKFRQEHARQFDVLMRTMHRYRDQSGHSIVRPGQPNRGS